MAAAAPPDAWLSLLVGESKALLEEARGLLHQSLLLQEALNAAPGAVNEHAAKMRKEARGMRKNDQDAVLLEPKALLANPKAAAAIVVPAVVVPAPAPTVIAPAPAPLSAAAKPVVESKPAAVAAAPAPGTSAALEAKPPPAAAKAPASIKPTSEAPTPASKISYAAAAAAKPPKVEKAVPPPATKPAAAAEPAPAVAAAAAAPTPPPPKLGEVARSASTPVLPVKAAPAAAAAPPARSTAATSSTKSSTATTKAAVATAAAVTTSAAVAASARAPAVTDEDEEMTLDDVPFPIAKPKEASFRSLSSSSTSKATPPLSRAQSTPEMPPGRPPAAAAKVPDNPFAPPPPNQAVPDNPFAPPPVAAAALTEVAADAASAMGEEGAGGREDAVKFSVPDASLAPEQSMASMSLDTMMLMAPKKNKLFARPGLRRVTLVDSTVRYYDKNNKLLGTFSILEDGFALKGKKVSSSPTGYELSFQPQNVILYPPDRSMLEEWAAAVENNLTLLHGSPDLGPETPTSFYDVLGIPRNAPNEAIRQAYQELAKQADDDERLESLLMAYTSLMETESRSLYDRVDAVRRALRKGVIVQLKEENGSPETMVLFADAEVRDLFWQSVKFGAKLSPRYQWLELRNVHKIEAVGDVDVKLFLDSVGVVLAFDSAKQRDALLETLEYFGTKRALADEQRSGRASRS